MATTTITTKSNTRFLGLPKNKTGLFAADTIHEVKPSRNHLINVPTLSPQFRNNGSANVLFASSEQNHHQLQQYQLSKNEIEQYYAAGESSSSLVDSANDSRSTFAGIRNGFRPSTVRHQKLRLPATIAPKTKHPRGNTSAETKPVFSQSHASAKLRSEIDHLNNKLKRHRERSKSLRLQDTRDFDGSPRSAVSSSTSCRLSSASPTLTADRIHQRFSSAITNVTAKTQTTVPATDDTSNQPAQILLAIVPVTSAPIKEPDDQQQETGDNQPTHAYQIPQRSNVGSESIFLTDPPILSSIKSRSAKRDPRSNDLKSISCPFYVMYLTNLTMQQRTNDEVTSLNMVSTTRKVPVNSRTSTANPRRLTTRRPVTSPISINTYSTIDDNDEDQLPNPATTSAHPKHVSAKLKTVDNDTSYILQDLLRTSSWNPVQV